MTPISLKAKEGLALINGTQLITSIGAEALERAGVIAKQADVVASLTLEVLKGTSRAFDSGNYLKMLCKHAYMKQFLSHIANRLLYQLNQMLFLLFNFESEFHFYIL